MSVVIGAYLCPRGAYLVEVRPRRGGFEVERAFEAPGHLHSAEDAAEHLAAALQENGITRARVAVALRGFELAHHTLALPPAADSMLAPIIERELKRLEPQLDRPALGWLPLPADDLSPEQPPQRQLLVAAVPRATVDLLERTLQRDGHTLLHLTAVPAAVQRLVEDFGQSSATTALLAPLPDGLFLGLFLGGGLRIAIEPPLQENDAPDGVAMAEEAELGATYVRQQFRGAEVERAVIAGPAGLWADTQSILTERLGVPVERLDLDGMSAASLVALGGVLDSRSPSPLALGGQVANRRQNQARATLRHTSWAAAAATVIVGVWTLFQALEARRADAQLRDTRRRIELATSGVDPIRRTAEQRRLMRDANAMLRTSIRDRSELQSALAAISGGILGPIRLDSLDLERGSTGWVAALNGSAAGSSSGGAVQALHDFYRDLPRRVLLEDLALGDMAYADTTTADGSGALIRFQLTFVLPERKD